MSSVSVGLWAALQGEPEEPLLLSHVSLLGAMCDIARMDLAL